MKVFNHEEWFKEWLENDCVATEYEMCDACPYVVYDENGTRKCDKEMMKKCESGELYGDVE